MSQWQSWSLDSGSPPSAFAQEVSSEVNHKVTTKSSNAAPMILETGKHMSTEDLYMNVLTSTIHNGQEMEKNPNVREFVNGYRKCGRKHVFKNS